jgi:hypothetical protein
LKRLRDLLARTLRHGGAEKVEPARREIGFAVSDEDHDGLENKGRPLTLRKRRHAFGCDFVTQQMDAF